MAVVIGQIESLKNLRSELDRRNIDLFNSINDIKSFTRTYSSKKNEIFNHFENEINDEIRSLNLRLKKKSSKLPDLKEKAIQDFENRIALKKENKLKLEKRKVKANLIYKWILSYKIKTLQKSLNNLSDNFDFLVEKSIQNIQNKITNDSQRLEYLSDNIDSELKLRSSLKIEKLKKVKEAIEELKPLIAGAVGENLVEKEIRKLSDDYILINDFNESFNPPLFNRRTNDRIYSVQIDHLLISKSGIFILETKNWSRDSINSLDLRSPVEQIQRTSFAVFLLVNNNVSLNYHHWGEKQIPIRNVIVMINAKPNKEFKHVKIKLLSELNNYIQYFDPILTKNEVDRIASYLSDYRY
ncbi:hypothetical protein KH5_07500 [Urechidicola sp. KH5]